MPTPQSPLTIRLLGTPQIERDGVALPLSSQKAQALLYYLAATGQPHTRDYLTALLWGDTILSDARHSLRSTLHKLRQALRSCDAESFLLIANDRLQLDMALVECDVLRFQQLTADGSPQALQAAVGLVRGPLLQGFSLADATLFEEFVRLEAARLARAHRAALEQLALLAEQRADWQCAVHYAEQLVQLDPLEEAAQRRLLSLYVRAGTPSLARRHYEHVERLFRDELGIEPAPETREALRIAVEQQRTEPPPPAPAAPPPVAAGLPFVGRAAWLAHLEQLAQNVPAGQGATVLIEGDAGIGKSRLISEFLAALATRSLQRWQCFHGRSSPFDTILTFGAFRDALQQRFPQPTDQPIAAQIQALLGALTQHGPLALALDDLHYADAQTLDLFGYLACHLHRLPLLLIGTVQRIDDLPALQRLVALGRRQGALEVIALSPLDQPAITTLLHELGVSAPDAAALAPWLHERSAGNPSVIEALLTQLRAEGLLQRHDASVQLDAHRWRTWRSTNRLPQTTHDLVSLRLTMLHPAARQIVNLLAVADDRLTLAQIAAALELPALAAQTAGEELLHLHLAVEHDDALALPHQLLRETVLAQLSALSRRALHQQLAIVLERVPTPGPAVQAQIARHAVAAGDLERARRFGMGLLRDLPQHLIGAETITFLKRLADLLEPTATPAELREVSYALSQSFRLLGQIEPARDWHQRQLVLARQSGLPGAEAIAHFEIADLALLSNDYAAAAAAAREGLGRALQATPTERPELQGRGYCLLGAALAMEGSDLPGAEEQLQRAIDAHRRAADERNLSSTLFELGNVVAQQGAIARAVTLYAEAAEAAERAHFPFLIALAQNNYAYHSLLLGRPAEARQALAHGKAVAERHDLSSVLLHLLSTESELSLYSGEWDAAEAACRQGLALAREFQNLERQAGYQAGLALAAAGRGQRREAVQQLEAALQLIAGHTFWHLRTRLLLWLVEQSLPTDPAAADRYLDPALSLARTQQRQLLLIQAERLQALRNAVSEPGTAQAHLVALLDRAAGLDLSLEVARTRAALAQVILRHAPDSAAGLALLDEARRDLERHGAYVALLALKDAAPLTR